MITTTETRAAKRQNRTVPATSTVSSKGKLFAKRYTLTSPGVPGDTSPMPLPTDVEAMWVKNSGASIARFNFNTEDITIDYIELAGGESIPVWIPIDSRTTLKGRGIGGAPASLAILFRG